MPTAIGGGSGRIAFGSKRDGNWNIYIMDVDGNRVTRLTDDPAQDSGPVWSPDGTQIAFESGRDEPDPGGCRLDCNYEIYVMDTDGSNVTNVTRNSAWDSAPAWSPDGNLIAFASRRDGSWNIYTMGADGSNVVRLTNHSRYTSSPAWSPDGTLIAFHSLHQDGYGEIYVMDADGGNVVRLTDDPLEDWSPAWQPRP